ncbi:conserved hypothetical protein [Ricinus communis]|uniref:Uncharacterized protein n=1 Tax=Ricinus communis TaxID=3988 RepID=B9RA80_RICCO|nr:conserved hypothetical protein [Ricinus communis]
MTRTKQLGVQGQFRNGWSVEDTEVRVGPEMVLKEMYERLNDSRDLRSMLAI